MNIEFNKISIIEEISKRLNSIEKQLQKITKKPSQEQKNYLTTQDVAKDLQFTTRHIQNLRDRGELPFIQHGRSVRYKREDVNAFIEQHYINPANYGGTK